MKRIIIVLMLMLPLVTFAANYSDVLAAGTTISYNNTYEDIAQFHESDWLVYESQSNPEDWFQIYFDDTSWTPAVYVYLYSGNISYKRITYADKLTVTALTLLIQWQQNEDTYSPLLSTVLEDRLTYWEWINGMLLI